MNVCVKTAQIQLRYVNKFGCRGQYRLAHKLARILTRGFNDYFGNRWSACRRRLRTAGLSNTVDPPNSHGVR